MNIKHLLFSLTVICSTTTICIAKPKKIGTMWNENLAKAERTLYACHCALYQKSQNTDNRRETTLNNDLNNLLSKMGIDKQDAIQEYMEQGFSLQEATQYVESKLTSLSEEMAKGNWHEATYPIKQKVYRNALAEQFEDFCEKGTFAGDTAECKKLSQKILHDIDELGDIHGRKFK